MRFVKQYPIAFFLVAAFVITYPLGIGGFLAIRGLHRSTGLDLSWAGELLLKFGPSLAGILTIALIAGGHGVRDLFLRCIRFRGPALFYLVAILIQPVILIVVLLIRGHGSMLSGIDLTEALAVFSTQLLLNVFLGGGLGEELGWRGFMLPKLGARYSALVANLLIAVAWFAWHVPAYILFDKGASDPVLPFAVISIPFSLILGWAYVRSYESLSLPILLHGSINAAYYSMEELLPAVTGQADFQPAFDWWLAVLWCVLAGLVLVRNWPMFTRKATDPVRQI